MSRQPNLYDILGVSPLCDDVVIHAAYRGLMRQHQSAANASGAAERIQQISAAYATLGTPRKRAAYDRANALTLERANEAECDLSGRAKVVPKSLEDGSTPHVPDESASVTVASVEATRASKSEPNDVDRTLAKIAGIVISIAVLIGVFASIDWIETGASGDTAVNVDEEMSVDDVLANDAGIEVPSSLSDTAAPALRFSLIEASASRFAAVFLESGIAGSRAFSQDCHKAAALKPTWEAFDRCAAFDYAAAHIDQAVSSGSGWPRDAYFQFQENNLDDVYAEAGADRLSLISRLAELKRSAEAAGRNAVQVQLAKKQEAEERVAREAAERELEAAADAVDNAMNVAEQGAAEQETLPNSM